MSERERREDSPQEVKEIQACFVPDMMSLLGKVVKREREIGTYYRKTLEQELRKDPVRGVRQISRLYDEMENETFGGNAQLKVLAGELPEFVTWDFYNAIGSLYEVSNRKQKDAILGQMLAIFDQINYGQVNGALGVGHTTGIRSPELLSDIAIVRPLYWPGLDEGREIIKKAKGDYAVIVGEVLGEDGLPRVKTVTSDFLVTDALIRKDFWPYNEKFADLVDERFLMRVLNGIVAMRFANAENDEQVQQGRNRLFELMPKKMHASIDVLRTAKDWVKPGPEWR